MSRKAKLSKHLLHKYLEQQCSEAEKALVENWYAQISAGETFVKEQSVQQEDLNTIKIKLNNSIGKRKTFMNFPKVVAAALALIVLSVGIIIYQIKVKENKPIALTHFDKEKAYLVQANGEQLRLDSLEPGKTLVISGLKIEKDDNGNVSYSLSEGSSVTPIKIVTPAAGQYKFTLPDGSLIHLNAGSSLVFKSNFGKEDRIINLDGEAYFEVKKEIDKQGNRLPFIVYSQGQKIEVLGTHFNVRAYQDEESTHVSLMEGAIELTALFGKREKIIIQPGQQYQLDKREGRINKIDSEVVKSVDWVNGYFKFENESIEVIFAQIFTLV